MLDKFKTLLSDKKEAKEEEFDASQLAVASLMVTTALHDGEFDEIEKGEISFEVNMSEEEEKKEGDEAGGGDAAPPAEEKKEGEEEYMGNNSHRSYVWGGFNKGGGYCGCSVGEAR